MTGWIPVTTTGAIEWGKQGGSFPLEARDLQMGVPVGFCHFSISRTSAVDGFLTKLGPIIETRISTADMADAKAPTTFGRGFWCPVQAIPIDGSRTPYHRSVDLFTGRCPQLG